MAKPAPDPAPDEGAVTTEEITTDPDSMGLSEAEMESLVIQTGGHMNNLYKPVRGTAPPDKVLFCVSQRAIDMGQFSVGWGTYTPEMYAEDKRRYGTRFVVEPKVEGGKLWVKRHWFVFMPKALHDRMREARARRARPQDDRPWEITPSGHPGEHLSSRGMVMRGGQWLQNFGQKKRAR